MKFILILEEIRQFAIAKPLVGSRVEKSFIEFIAPAVRFWENYLPQLFTIREVGHVIFLAISHIYLINLITISRIGKAYLQLSA